MTITFNAIILALLFAYAIWMGYAEHKKEQVSSAGLKEDETRRFAQAYSFGRPNENYPEDLRAHAAIVQKARIRKGAAVVICVVVPLVVLVRGV